MQNILVGFGAILGESLGGVIAEGVGWRWCFLLQTPVSLLALLVGYKVLENPPDTVLELAPDCKFRHALKHLDLSGAFTLVLGLATQLVGLSCGGNDYPWNSLPVIGSLVLSGALLMAFTVVEAETKSIPVVPLRMLKGWQRVAVQLTNLFSGMASYAVSYLLRPAWRLTAFADHWPIVFVYDSSLFSGSPWRLPIRIWNASYCPIPSNSSRRNYCRKYDATWCSLVV